MEAPRSQRTFILISVTFFLSLRYVAYVPHFMWLCPQISLKRPQQSLIGLA